MPSSRTAPMKATRMTPPIPPMGADSPSILNTHPPKNAPQIPMMMSPMSPSPVPPITSDASRPATSPTMSQVSRSIVSIREEVKAGIRSGSLIAADGIRRYFTSLRATLNPYGSEI